MKSIQRVHLESIPKRIAEQISVHGASDTVEVVVAVQPVPSERIQERAAEEIIISLEPRTTEKIAEMFQPVLQERIQARVGEQIVDVPVPSI